MVNVRIGKGSNAKGRNGKGRNGRKQNGHKPPEEVVILNTEDKWFERGFREAISERVE